MNTIFKSKNFFIRKNSYLNFLQRQRVNKFCTNNSQKPEYIEPPKFQTNLNSDLEIAKKQIFWRIRNLGQLELEWVVFKWYDAHQEKLSLGELKEFSEEVLEMENPELNNYLVNFKEADKKLKYVNKIQEYCKC